MAGTIKVIADIKSTFGSDVAELVAKSPTLTNNLNELLSGTPGWEIKFGKAGEGTYVDKDNQELVIDPNQKGNTAEIVQSLAHESGHATYKAGPYIKPDGLTRKEYIEKNADRHLKDEGEATLSNLDVRAEILKNGGEDIGIAGSQDAKYLKAYEQYIKSGDRDSAREAIGDIYGKNEYPSTDPSKTYEQYYQQTYIDFYDKHIKKPAPDRKNENDDTALLKDHSTAAPDLPKAALPIQNRSISSYEDNKTQLEDEMRIEPLVPVPGD